MRQEELSIKLGGKWMRSRDEMVKLAQSWIGKKESDGSFRFIIDLYNSFKPLPRGYKLRYTDSWCAGTLSALAIKLGYTDIIPIECSCGQMIELAKKMGIWVENDAYVPSKADFILYDWDDNGVGDNTGWPEHIGMVEKVEGMTITVIEGNYSDSVKRRTIQVNGKYIRGYITPKYDTEIQNEEKKVETKKNNAKVIWDAFIKAGYSPIATAGFMGNLQAESGLKPNNLQNSFEKKIGYDDEQYSLAVSNKVYSKEKFVKDSAGYGLAQWTYHTRKKAMYEFIIEQRKTRIDDLQAQLDFLFYELNHSYKGLVDQLKTCKTVKSASDLVLTQFEKPANQSMSVMNTRANYGMEFYNKYK